MNWYACYTLALREFAAYREIYEQRIQVFLPILKRSTIKRNRRMIISEPLFTSYLFVSTSNSDDLNIVRQCKEIEYIYENNGTPIPVPQNEIARFQEAERTGLFDFTRPIPQFKINTEVEITEGPFAGMIAKVRSASPSKRVKLLMKLLGGEVPISVDACNLKKVG